MFRWIHNLLLRFRRWGNTTTVTPLVLPLKVIRGEYPVNTRYINEAGGVSTIIVEMFPSDRMVFVRGASPLCLYFPYTYFIIRYCKANCGKDVFKYAFADMLIGFSAEQLTDLRGRVSHLPLSNYDGTCRFCLGSNKPRGIYDTVREVAEAAIDCFWKTSFQMDRDDISNWVHHTKTKSAMRYLDACMGTTFSLGELLGIVKTTDQFFTYQSEPIPQPEQEHEPKPKRKSRNKSSGGKKRKSSRRKT